MNYMSKLETYSVVCSSEEESMIYAISLVDDPANMSEFIYMNKESIKLNLNKEKRLVTGIVLIPEQLIFRFNERLNREYYLKFSDEVIRELSQNFFRNGYHKNSNINHDDKQVINNLSYVESWIVEDPDNDKANALGFKGLVRGTWMATAHIGDDEVWEKVKSGEVKGFSIESFIETELIEMNMIENKNKNEEKMSLLKKLIVMFSANGNIKLSTVESNIGQVTADAFELDNIVYQEVDGEIVPLVDATFVVEDITYVTDGVGNIIDVQAVEAVLEDEEEVKEEDVKEEDLEGEEDDVDYKSILEEISKELETIIEENEVLKEKVKKLSKQAGATKLKANNVVRDRANETRMEALNRIARS